MICASGDNFQVVMSTCDMSLGFGFKPLQLYIVHYLGFDDEKVVAMKTPGGVMKESLRQ